MAVVRRFLVASALARLVRRERGATRVVEGHFPPRPDRTQFVRVQGDDCYLILSTTRTDGQLELDQWQVPLPQAEALIDIASGRLAFDRTEVPLGLGATGVLDHFIVPNGVDLVTVTITSDPRLFAPPLWLGQEVTGDTRFEMNQLALDVSPQLHSDEVSNAALEALLDWLDGQSLHLVETTVSQTGSPVEAAESTAFVPRPANTVVEVRILPSPVEAAPADLPDLAQPDPEAAKQLALEETAEAEGSENAEALPSERQHGPRRPTLGGEVLELDEGIARIARSLAPRRFS